jgi:hypothetical protein
MYAVARWFLFSAGSLFIALILYVILGPAIGDWFFVSRTKTLAGESAIDCGRLAVMTNPQSHLLCANEALKNQKAFHLVIDHKGIDSHIAESVVRASDGKMFLLRYDSAPCGNPLCPPSRRERACEDLLLAILPMNFFSGHSTLRVTCTT